MAANTVDLNFTVTKQAITRADAETVASGAINTLVANFDFCDTWDGLYKFCRFEGAGGIKDVRIEDDKCVIPWEVIEAPSFKMSVFGTLSSDIMLTTAKLSVKVYQSADLISNEPLPSTPAMVEKYEQMFIQAQEIGEELSEMRDNGAFNGENGRDGIIATVPSGMYGLEIDSDDGHLYMVNDDQTRADLGRVVGGGDSDSAIMPAGIINQFAGTVAPDGWLMCNGQTVRRTDYAELFAAIGTTYGNGDGSTTFALPNLLNRVAIGASDSHALATTGGEETHVLTVEEMPAHKHGGYYRNKYSTSSSGTGLATANTSGASNTPNAMAEAGGGAAHNNMQPYIALNYIISTGK